LTNPPSSHWKNFSLREIQSTGQRLVQVGAVNNHVDLTMLEQNNLPV